MGGLITEFTITLVLVVVGIIFLAVLAICVVVFGIFVFETIQKIKEDLDDEDWR